MNTGCLKIFKRARGFDNQNNFIPVEKRGQDVELFRGRVRVIELQSDFPPVLLF